MAIGHASLNNLSKLLMTRVCKPIQCKMIAKLVARNPHVFLSALLVVFICDCREYRVNCPLPRYLPTPNRGGKDGCRRRGTFDIEVKYCDRFVQRLKS